MNRRKILEGLVAQNMTVEEAAAHLGELKNTTTELQEWITCELLPTYLQSLVTQGRSREAGDAFTKGASVCNALDFLTQLLGMLKSDVDDIVRKSQKDD